MHIVYWSVDESGIRKPRSREFHNDDIASVLSWLEELREKKRLGESVSFISLSSENSNSVGLMGVAEVKENYNWKKRRC